MRNWSIWLGKQRLRPTNGDLKLLKSVLGAKAFDQSVSSFQTREAQRTLPIDLHRRLTIDWSIVPEECSTLI